MSTTLEKIHGTGSPTHAIIWLHGLGATADDFVPVIPYLKLAQAPAVRFVFPQAPDRPITVNGEAYNNVMPQHSFLSNEDVASVLTYIRASFGNNASPVSAQEVEKIRQSL